VERAASPGQEPRHYAPHTPLRLDATPVRPDEALLAFGGVAPAGARVTINLSPSGNLEEAAARLFAALRELDQAGVAAIAVMPIPAIGLGEAINDRLRRAADRG
jgi:L-threonylcarbamoyladenylate synthase